MSRFKIILNTFVLVVVTFATGAFSENAESSFKHRMMLKVVGNAIESSYFQTKAIDGKFSKDVFFRFFKALDPEKSFFLDSDIQSLSKYQTHLDKEIEGAETPDFVLDVRNIFQKRIAEVEGYYKEILASPFDFQKVEQASFDFEKMGFPKNEAEKKELWRKRLKYLTLERLADSLDTKEDATKPVKVKVHKSEPQLEKEAREKVAKVVGATLEHLKRNLLSDDDAFNAFAETMVSSLDPHSAFFAPIQKRSFEEQMSGHFYGIGAALQRTEDGDIKITSIVPGSPAAKSGQIAVGDVIVAISAPGLEETELTGYFVEDAVKLIRGEKGTPLKLTLQKPDGNRKTASLVRDEIMQEESFARSAIIQGAKGSRIGYIVLPEFYADFQKVNARRSFTDVANEILKLKAQKVDGIVLDLRNNGGGSLQDVIQMIGLFVPTGPALQVKMRDGSLDQEVTQSKVIYEGPLTVLVNEYSASASEIFAAAIQDYHRGVIIGSPNTYGKGTVQALASLGDELGAIKLTQEKFYRITGASTQRKGVSSDIVLPDIAQKADDLELNNPDSLAWDVIPAAKFHAVNEGYDLAQLKSASASRVEHDPAFEMIRSNIDQIDSGKDKVVSLNLTEYRKKSEAIRKAIKSIETKAKLTKAMKVEGLAQDNAKIVGKDKRELRDKWLKNLSTDIYVGEAVNVENDMREQIRVAAKP